MLRCCIIQAARHAFRVGRRENLPSRVHEWARAGLLMSYSAASSTEVRSCGAIYAAKSVNGAKPGDLPIEQCEQFHFA